LQVKVTGARLAVPVNALLFVPKDFVPSLWMQIIKRISSRSPSARLRHHSRSPAGLDVNDWIVLNPADSLDEGQEVHVKEIALNHAPSQPAPQPNSAPGAKKQ